LEARREVALAAALAALGEQEGGELAVVAAGALELGLA